MVMVTIIHLIVIYSLAPIGGLIEPGEEPQEAAKRELLEEAGLGKSGLADDWPRRSCCDR